MSAGTAGWAERFAELFGDREPAYQRGPEHDSDGCPPHCGHFTRWGWDTLPATLPGTHGGREVQCCHCGATTEARYIFDERSDGHGKYAPLRRHRVFAEPPDGWRFEEPTP